MLIFAIILGLLPSFAWLIFFLKEDVHPEPKRMIIKTFFAGALITLLAISFQFALREIFLSFKIEEHAYYSFFVFGFVEEALKFLAAYLVVRKSRFFDEPIDAMIYMITAALGFAMMENIAVALNTSNIQEAIGAMTLRFVGATLLHALASGIVGYYWAKSMIHNAKLRMYANAANLKTNNWVLIFKGLILASLLHMIFNYLILISKEQILIYPTIFLIIIALLVFWDFEKVKGFVQKSEPKGE